MFSKIYISCCCCCFSHVPTLCDPIDGSPPGSPIPGILQARTLEWVAISFSNVWKWKVKVKSLSHVWLLATPWTAANQAPRCTGFSRQEYWSGVPLPSPIYIIHTIYIYTYTKAFPLCLVKAWERTSKKKKKEKLENKLNEIGVPNMK